MKALYERVSYLTFRLYYTITHWLFFFTMPKSGLSDRTTIDRPYIIVCGIEAADAYSITKLNAFITLCEYHFPGKQVVLFSKDQNSIARNLSSLKVVNWEYQERARALGTLAKILYRPGIFDEQVIVNTATQSMAMVDLGHYQATSTKASGFTANMLANLVFAKRFGLPFHFMPQSFGPFNYPKPLHFTLIPMLKTILPYATQVCTRDDISLDRLTGLSPDIKVQPGTEFLFYSALLPANEWQHKARLTVIPDPVQLKNESKFLAYLDQVAKTANRLQITNFEVLIYDDLDIKLFSGIRLPSVWSIKIHDDITIPLPATRPDSLYVTTKYHAAIHYLRYQVPVILWQGDHVGRSIYTQLGMDILLADDIDTLETAVSYINDRISASELQNTLRKGLINAQKLLPDFFRMV